MTNTSVRPVRKAVGILTGISAAYAGLRLALSCLGIYRAGEFTPEIVAAAFQPISLPCYACLALIALGLLLDLLFPGDAPKPKAFQTNSQLLTRLGKKADLSAWDEAHVQELTALERSRLRAAALRSLALLACSAVFLVYALNPGNFHASQINGSMIQAMWILLPCLAVSFAAALWAHYYMERNRVQTIALLKQAPTAVPKAETEASPARSGRTLKAAVVCLAAALILFGFFTGGTADVLTKAVNICTECVGLG